MKILAILVAFLVCSASTARASCADFAFETPPPSRDPKVLHACVASLALQISLLETKLKTLENDKSELIDLHLDMKALKRAVCALALDLRAQQRWTKSPADPASTQACLLD